MPQALGLTTKQWVNERLGGYIRLSVPERREAVKNLTAEGHSTREIGDIVGVSHEAARLDAKFLTELEQSRKREAALREQLRLAQTPAEIPQQRYGTIVIDPPWPMKKIERVVRPNRRDRDEWREQAQRLALPAPRPAEILQGRPWWLAWRRRA